MNECNKKYFELVFARFLPPQDLYIPVLPWRHEEEDGRLIFPLCRKCAENGQETVCEHKEDDRELKGVYCTPELEVALKKGYRIVELYEIWNFKRGKGVFTPYVNKFLKFKTEASGLPPGVPSIRSPLCDDYIRKIDEKENVKLEKRRWRIRTLHSDTLLNSF